MIVSVLLSIAVAYAPIEIPRMAHQLRPTLVREVRFWWSIEEETAKFFAQIHQESSWNPSARSPVGAEGLSQFMPSTREWISNLYPKDLGDNDAFSPSWAIRALVIYDKYLYNRLSTFSLSDRFPATLSAYNGGLGWVFRDQRLASSFLLDSALWFDNVELHSERAEWAFRENRSYVRRIWLVLTPLYTRAGF